MKRLLAILMASLLLLTACGPDQPGTSTPSDVSEQPSAGDTTTTDWGDVTTDGTGDTTTDTQAGDTTTGTGDTTTGTGDNSTTAQQPTGGNNNTTTAQKPTGGNNNPTTTTTTKKPTTTTTKQPILGASEVAWYQSIVNTENAWLASTQLSNGALPMTPTTNGVVKVCPYFSDFAALSMLNQADKYASNVKKYMDWHFSHLNTAKTDYNGVDGTIYDYNVSVSGGKVTKEAYLETKGSYDSTDSYAATFLMVVQKYVEKTGDKAYVIAHAKDIDRIVNAMFATMVTGLTLAKPDYAIKYLMDNCEVYEGMLAGEKLYRNVLVPAGAATAATRDKLKNGAAQVADRIEKKMWAGSYYRPALGHDDTVAYSFAWSNFYPSATAQLFPILHGLIAPTSDRAKTLYQKFCDSYDWENHNIPDTFYWGSNVWTAAMMQDTARVKTYITAYEKVAMKRHAYPLYNADAAKVCMAAYLMTQLG